MNKLVELIRDSKNAQKEELVASTVRLPMKLNSFVEALADQVSLSKQETLLHLIEAGVKIAQDELKLDDPEDEKKNQDQADRDQKSCGFHILNTNKRHSLEDQVWMLKEGVAGAFYDPWKFNIDRIKKGDVVFLYENGVGIVAYGNGTGKVIRQDRGDDSEETHYQKLDAFKVLSKPLPAAEIKKIAGRSVVFLRVMSAIPEGQKVLDRIIAQEDM
ncbi:hypothetical protein [Rhodoferax sp.]|uniref:hypothetical protein n=1 Tax=Rhodoferax sp. TaxID=50421 RepID=UPI00261D89A9|nr:hypothetical protein [Rhodoferax sp.]MDD4943468.1 hypothetical protein [Rhodoferax sp.]MDD5480838.1 hypothetical protein [Rhodoferax sp.]